MESNESTAVPATAAPVTLHEDALSQILKVLLDMSASLKRLEDKAISTKDAVDSVSKLRAEDSEQVLGSHSGPSLRPVELALNTYNIDMVMVCPSFMAQLMNFRRPRYHR